MKNIDKNIGLFIFKIIVLFCLIFNISTYCLVFAATVSLEEQLLIKKAHQFYQEQDEALMATISLDGIAKSRAMVSLRKIGLPQALILADEPLFVNYFSSTMNSEKVREIKANPKGTLYYFTSKNTVEGLLLYGQFKVITNQEIKNKLWDDAWQAKYIQGKFDKNYILIKFIPEKGDYYYRGKNHYFKVPEKLN